MGSTNTDITTTLAYGKDNRARPFFYAYKRSAEEREKSHHKADFDGSGASVEVTVRDRRCQEIMTLDHFTVIFDLFSTVKGRAVMDLIFSGSGSDCLP